MSIQDRSVEIGPYVPEADDERIICRCEEISPLEMRIFAAEAERGGSDE